MFHSKSECSIEPLQIECDSIIPASSPNSNDGKIIYKVFGDRPPYYVTGAFDTILDEPGIFSRIGLRGDRTYLNPWIISNYRITNSQGACLLRGECPSFVPSCPEIMSIDKSDIYCEDELGSLEIIMNDAPYNQPYSYNWNGPSPISDLKGANLLEGTYYVTITDALNCVIMDSIVISKTPPILLNCTKVFDDSNPIGNVGNGQIFVEFSGGSGPNRLDLFKDGIRIEIQNISGISSHTFSNLDAGQYLVRYYDVLGCIDECQVEILNVCNPEIELTANGPNCGGGSDGQATISVTDLTPPLTIEWTGSGVIDGQLTQTGLSAGEYSVTVTDINSCAVDTFFTLVDPPPLSMNCSVGSPISFFDGNDGEIDVIVTNGTFPYTVTYAGPLIGTEVFNTAAGTLTDLDAGTYVLEMEDGNGCRSNCEVTLEAFVCTMIVTANPVDPSCLAIMDGYISLAITGVNQPIQVKWYQDGNLVSTNEDLEGVGIGTYQVEVTDGTECIFSDTFELIATSPSISLITKPNICVGNFNGSATVVVTGLTEPLSIEWTGAGTIDGQLSQNGLAEGDYTLTVTDINGCAVDTFFTLVDPSPFTMNCSVGSPISFFEGNDGEVDILFIDGESPYTVIYTGPTSGVEIFNLDKGTISGLIAGTYILEVEDINGCRHSCEISLNSYECDLVVTSEIYDLNCAEVHNGSIRLNVFTSNPPVEVNWSKNGEPYSQEEDIYDLGPGQYDLELIDATSCIYHNSFQISARTPSIDLVTSRITCRDTGDGYAEINYGGLTEPVSIDWFGPGSVEDALIQSHLAGGNYSVMITGADGCTVDTSFTLDNPESLNIFCAEDSPESIFEAGDGVLRVEISGGVGPYQLEASGPWTTQISSDGPIVYFTEMLPGEYNVSVIDASGCRATCPVSINAFLCKQLMLGNITPPSCKDTEDGKIELISEELAEPLRIIWYYNNTVFSRKRSLDGLGPGAYSVFITDVNNCSYDTTFVVPDVIPLKVKDTVLLHSPENKSQGQVDISVSGGSSPYFIRYTGPSSGAVGIIGSEILLDELEPGTYQILVTDQNGCSITSAFTVDIMKEDCSILIDAITNNPTCETYGSIQIQIVNGTNDLEYFWTGPDFSNNEKDINNLEPGEYFLEAYLDENCIYRDSFIIVAPTGIDIVCNIVDSIATPGGAEGKVGIALFNAAFPLVGYVSGSNHFDSIWLSDPVDSIFFSELHAGEYEFEVIDARGCQAACLLTIEDKDCDVSFVATVLEASCYGAKDGKVQIAVYTDASYAHVYWDGDSVPQRNFSISDLLAGSYAVSIIDAHGCMIADSIEVGQPEQVHVSAVLEHDQGGGSGSIDLTVSGGNGDYLYKWSNGKNTQDISNLAYGSYRIEVIDSAGCVEEASFEIEDQNTSCAAFTIQAVIRDATCLNSPDGSVRVTAQGGLEPYYYTWNTGDSLTSLGKLTPGSYSLRIEDQNGCQIEETYIIEASDVIKERIDTHFCAGNDIGINGLLIQDEGIYYDTTFENDCATIFEIHVETIELLLDSVVTVPVNECNPTGKILIYSPDLNLQWKDRNR